MTNEMSSLSTTNTSSLRNTIMNFLKKIPSFFVLILFVIIELFFLGVIIINSKELVKIKMVQLFPAASNPVARFVTKIDWKTRTIQFDASASKTYNNKVEKYIWRIDDGASSMDNVKFTHTFESPGYYEVLFSLVDTNGQSDQANCRILFPPQEVEQIEESAEIQNVSTSATDVKKEIRYKWVPKGIFFNYSKLNTSGLGDLRSPFVETGCGYSDNSYNSSDEYQNLSERNSILRKSVPGLVIGFIGMIVVGVWYLKMKKKQNHL